MPWLILFLVFNLQAADLDRLLEQVKQDQMEQQRINREREARFLAQKEQQAQLLKQARAELAALQAEQKALQQQYQQQAESIDDLEQQMQQEQGDLMQLFDFSRHMAAETAKKLQDSLVSAQYPDRHQVLTAIAEAQSLSLQDLHQLWYQIQHEITASSKIIRYQGQILNQNGEPQTTEIIRIGPFNAISQGQFLGYLPQNQQLMVLQKQPSWHLQRIAHQFEQAPPAQIKPMVIDPTRGEILHSWQQMPDLKQRLAQGKEVGWIIIAVAGLGLSIALYRWLVLSWISFKIKKQLKQPQRPQADNPLGRVLLVWQPQLNLATLERRLDEAIIKELPALQSGLPLIKILAVIAPLLGLLGTVVGMIQTFQSISLLGTGDPRLMAGGISQALITTVLGLMTAIPLSLLHSLLQEKSRHLMQILEEQAAGIIARQAESA